MRFILSLTVLLLSACSSTPLKYLSQEPVNVNPTQLKEYWIQSAEVFVMNTPLKRSPKARGVVEVKYLIDSNGNTFEYEVVKSHPEGLWDSSALKAATKMKFSKSKSNNQAIPVYVTGVFEFNLPYNK